MNQRSAKVIEGLAAVMRPLVTEFVNKAHLAGFDIVLVAGTRTMDEQSKIYEQGRSLPGKIVSNAKPGSSAHNFGLAIDFAFIGPKGQPVWPEDAPWATVAMIGKQLGLEWGGDWKSIQDRPHLEHKSWRGVRAAWEKSGEKGYKVV